MIFLKNLQNVINYKLFLITNEWKKKYILEIFFLKKNIYFNNVYNIPKPVFFWFISVDLDWLFVRTFIKTKVYSKEDNSLNYDKKKNQYYYKQLFDIMRLWVIRYKISLKLVNNFYNNYKNSVIKFLNIIIFNIKWLLIAIIISFIYFFSSLFYIQVDLAKQIALWYIVLIFYYLLMSTFNSFLNKYRYGKFTSAIQRFWKRTGMVFWLIEGFLFLLFFYYFLNSSQEPLYMFDYSNLNQELLIQLKSSYKNMILLSFCIYFSFILILNLNFLIFYQSITILGLISIIIFYMLYIETYQFVYILNIFADNEWNFEESTQLWSLEVEQNNLRVKQQYFILCLIAKYWHFIFIFISWFFFFIKSIEMDKISITLLGYNTQNLLILYILNLLCIVQWLKYIFKKFLDITYYWFHIQYDEKFFIMFILEIWNIIKNFFNLNYISKNIINLILYSNKLIYSSDLVLWKFI